MKTTTEELPGALPDGPAGRFMEELLARLDRIETALRELTRQHQIKDHYSVEEFAELVGLAPFTVAQHCRMGRIRATKKGSGRGPHKGWAIAHEELLRYRRDGLLPLRLA